MQPIDPNKPQRIAPQTYWVGSVLNDTELQCHVYLIENGDHSILIDPGSKLTWGRTKEKIESILPLNHIRYLVFSHQDPDIAALPESAMDTFHPDVTFLSHSRTSWLLEHYGWQGNYYMVDDHDFKIDIPNRPLEFIFTPYLHFPGAICTYDPKSKVLFTSDLFGAMTPQFQLYVTSEQAYFEQMTPFHQHYMPSQQILNHGLDNIEQKAFDLIAPQHGAIISKPFIDPIISRLRELEVGLFLNLKNTDWALNYSKLEVIYDKLIELAMFTITPTQDTIEKVQQYLSEIIPIQQIVFLNQIEEQCLVWNSSNFSEDVPSTYNVRPLHCEDYQKWLSTLEQAPNNEKEGIASDLADITFDPPHRYFAFIDDNNNDTPFGVTLLLFSKEPKLTTLERQFLHRLKKPLSLLLRKAIEAYRYQQQAQALYQKATTDPLTQLNNRYLFQSLSKLKLEEAKRHHTPLTLVEFDLDHFKQINDTYGHDVGDLVLKDFSDTLKQNIREIDQLFRIGGEEFVLLMPFTTKEQALEVIERIRDKLLKKGGIEYQGQKIPYNFSTGIAQFQDEKEVSELYKRADNNLYEAKNSGRGRSVIS